MWTMLAVEPNAVYSVTYRLRLWYIREHLIIFAFVVHHFPFLPIVEIMVNIGIVQAVRNIIGREDTRFVCVKCMTEMLDFLEPFINSIYLCDLLLIQFEL